MRRNGHKFNAVKTIVDGHKFASKAEVRRYGELKLLEKAGEIFFLTLQPRYDLELETPEVTLGAYVADFSYMLGSKLVVEDVKGVKTALYRWKKKHFEAQYGITITEILR